MWWYNLQAKGKKEDPLNHTLWEHKWSWHNRGTMWDNLVTEWAQNNDWITQRGERSTIEERRKFATFALDKMKLCTSHEKGEEPSKGKGAQSKAQRNLGSGDTTVHEKPVCTTLQMCGDNQVISKWTHGDFTVGGIYQKKIGAIQRVLHNGGSKILRDP